MYRQLSFAVPLLNILWATSSLAQPMEALAYIRVGVTDPITQARKELTRGTGFLIDKRGHIITARHVILAKQAEEPGPRWISVALRDKNAYPVTAQLVSCDAEPIDLCLIKVQDASVSAAQIGTVFKPVCRQLGDSERILALGFPFGENNPAIKVPGDITGAIATELKYPSNVQIIPGMSGGPVLDETGNVVAVNAAGSTLFPTMTFLQPLFYGEGLIRRSGVTCDAAPTPAAAIPPSVPAVIANQPRSPQGPNSPSCSPKEQIVSRTQHSQNEPTPSVREYFEVIEPDTGCRIASIVPEIRSANNSSGPSITIGSDGVGARVSYSLQSGPFFDRYRGWIDMKLIINQQSKS